MNREFLPYDKALKLKELGFEERCFTRYYESGKLADSLSYLHHNYFGQVNAPTFSQAFRWFREKYGLYADIHRNGVKFIAGIEDIITGNSKETVIDNGVEYEEAELACLDKLIEIIESKQNKNNERINSGK